MSKRSRTPDFTDHGTIALAGHLSCEFLMRGDRHRLFAPPDRGVVLHGLGFEGAGRGRICVSCPRVEATVRARSACLTPLELTIGPRQPVLFTATEMRGKTALVLQWSPAPERVGFPPPTPSPAHAPPELRGPISEVIRKLEAYANYARGVSHQVMKECARDLRDYEHDRLSPGAPMPDFTIRGGPEPSRDPFSLYLPPGLGR